MKKIIRLLRKTVSRINIELSTKIMYRAFVHKKLNMNPPKTFNEKLCWLKLKVFPKDEMVIRCADKYQVHEYIKSKGYAELLVKLVDAWDTVDEIEWEKLPEKFVLKCNHGCAYNIICSDKNQFDVEDAKRKLRKWMKEDFGLVSGEPHYSKIRKKIICEEFLEGELKDYKFYCFNGMPRFYYVAVTPGGDFHNMRCDFFWPNGEAADFYRLDHKRFDVTPEPPKNLEEMLEIAKKLSEDFNFVRVDLMNVNEKVYFSELTFTPSAGIMPLAPDDADERIGEWLDLSAHNKQQVSVLNK